MEIGETIKVRLKQSIRDRISSRLYDLVMDSVHRSIFTLTYQKLRVSGADTIFGLGRYEDR
jgi:hypothetical protein